MAAPTALPLDGRLARSERSRRAVVDALLDLLEEGDPRPAAARIAERAGVSLRSIYQHFESLEALLAAAADRHVERLAPLMRPVDVAAPLTDRLQVFAARRARLLEAMTPVRRASLREEPRSAEVAVRLERIRTLGRLEVEHVFAGELERLDETERREVAAGLAVAASWSTWEELRRHQGLPPARARRVLHRMLAALLGAAPEAGAQSPGR